MRKSNLFLMTLGLLLGCFLLTFLDVSLRTQRAIDDLGLMRRQVSALELTDLSLFTEARYVRHLSQADYHTPFQDHPLALEHFPTGSLVMPPALLDKRP